MSTVWIFTGPKAPFPAGAFASRATAEKWIQQHGLSGTLTAYPLDVGAYDWAVAAGHFTPRKEDQRSAEFIQRFSSASQEHHHYEHGRA
ncbi:MAG: DUF7710 domain-containing protein [Prosthecobacter sp.]